MKNDGTYSLKGMVVLITGGGTGIGRACAKSAAEAQAKCVILCGRRLAPLEEASGVLRANFEHTRFLTIAADITQASDRKRILEVVGQIGDLDGLVNNAGLFEGNPLASTSDQSWDHLFAVNVDAPFQLMRDLLPWLKQSSHASVVNISSTLGVKPIPNTAGYNASKAALIQLSRSLALELAADKIRINCILPGVVETDMYRSRYPDNASYEAGIQGAASIHPLGRVGRPEDISDAVRFLLSPAASWITGVALPVDGGMLVT